MERQHTSLSPLHLFFTLSAEIVLHLEGREINPLDASTV